MWNKIKERICEKKNLLMFFVKKINNKCKLGVF